MPTPTLLLRILRCFVQRLQMRRPAMRRPADGRTRWVVVAAVLVMLGGCAAGPLPEGDSAAGNDAVTAGGSVDPGEDASGASGAGDSEVEATPEEPQYPVAPFEGDQLYDLLVAEVAVYRGQLDAALDGYMKVTRDSGDVGVASRAAMLARYLKRDQETIDAARVWTDAEPAALEGHRLLVELLMKRRDLKGAIEHLEAVKRLGGLANFQLFAIQSEGQDPATREALLDAFDRLMVDYPDDPQLMFGRAVILLREGRGAESLATAERLLERELTVNTAILKVNALKQLGRTAELLEYLDGVVGTLAASNPEGSKRLRMHYAQQLFEDQRFPEAKGQYEIVLAGSPQDGNVLFALALIAMEQNDDTAARQHLSDMVRWDKRAGEAHFYLGSIAERNSETELAIHEYMQAGNGYEFLPAQARIASLMLDQGRMSEARSYLTKVRQSRTDLYDQLIMVEAQLLADRGFQRQVFEFLDATITADPDNTDFLYFRAMTGQQFGDLLILERDLRRVIELEPENAAALNALGYTLTDQTDRHEEALELIRKALAIKPDEAAFIDSLGWVQYRLQNYEESLVHLRRALDLFPNDEVAAHLGEVLWVTGREAEADEVWAEALERKPESEILRKVMRRLKDLSR